MTLACPCYMHTAALMGKGHTFWVSPAQCCCHECRNARAIWHYYWHYFLFLCTHCVYPSVFPSRNCTRHAAEDGLKTKPVLIFMFSYCRQRYALKQLLHLTHDMHQLIRCERESRNRIFSKKKEKQLTWWGVGSKEYYFQGSFKMNLFAWTLEVKQ